MRQRLQTRIVGRARQDSNLQPSDSKSEDTKTTNQIRYSTYDKRQDYPGALPGATHANIPRFGRACQGLARPKFYLTIGGQLW